MPLEGNVETVEETDGTKKASGLNRDPTLPARVIAGTGVLQIECNISPLAGILRAAIWQLVESNHTLAVCDQS